MAWFHGQHCVYQRWHELGVFQQAHCVNAAANDIAACVISNVPLALPHVCCTTAATVGRLTRVLLSVQL